MMIYLTIVLILVLALTLGAWFFFSTRLETTKTTVQATATSLDEKIRKLSDDAHSVFATKDSLTSTNSRMNQVEYEINNTISDQVANLKHEDKMRDMKMRYALEESKNLVKDELYYAQNAIYDTVNQVRKEVGSYTDSFGSEIEKTKSVMQDWLDTKDVFWNHKVVDMEQKFKHAVQDIYDNQGLMKDSVISRINSLEDRENATELNTSKLTKDTDARFASYDAAFGNHIKQYQSYIGQTENQLTGYGNDITTLKSEYGILKDKLNSDITVKNEQYDHALAAISNKVANTGANVDIQLNSMNNKLTDYQKSLDNLDKQSQEYSQNLFDQTKSFIKTEESASRDLYKSMYDDFMKQTQSQMQQENLILRDYSNQNYKDSILYTDAQMNAMSNSLKQYTDNQLTTFLVGEHKNSDALQSMMSATDEELKSYVSKTTKSLDAINSSIDKLGNSSLTFNNNLTSLSNDFLRLNSNMTASTNALTSSMNSLNDLKASTNASMNTLNKNLASLSNTVAANVVYSSTAKPFKVYQNGNASFGVDDSGFNINSGQLCVGGVCLTPDDIQSIKNIKVQPFDSLNGSFELGNYNMGPWNATNFVDNTAKWIWNEAGAAGNAGNLCVAFERNFSSSKQTEVVVHAISDDQGAVFLNGALIGRCNGGWGGGNYAKLKAKVSKGVNVIKVQARNMGGPAGLLLAVISNPEGVILAHTDKTWTRSPNCDVSMGYVNKPGNNGTVSCDTYCSGTWVGGPKGSCAMAYQNDQYVVGQIDCSLAATGLDGKLHNVTCACEP